MRILQINTVCGTGSTGRIALALHNSLCENKHESYVAYGRGERYTSNNLIKISNRIDFYLHAVNTRLFDLHGYGSKMVTKLFLKKIVEINPDIIHLHNIHGYYLNIEILFSFLKSYKKPIIWNEQAVSIVMLFAISREERAVFHDVYDNLIVLLLDKANATKVIESKTYIDFIEAVIGCFR